MQLAKTLTHKITLLSTTIALSPLVAFLSLTLAPTLTPDSASASTILNLSATVDPVLSMSVATYNPATSSYDSSIKNIIMEIPHGTTSTLASRILTSTNNAYGYTLSVSDTDNITDLAPVINGVYDTSGSTITPVAENTALSSFNDNTWGYAVQTTSTSAPEPSAPTTYNPITTISTSLYDTSAPSSEYHYFTVAAKVGDTFPANSYQDQVVFSLVANAAPEPAPGLCTSNETCMQKIADICPTISTGNTKQLTDARDGQKYTVFKANDGNCWMTENLRLGAEPDTSASPADAATAKTITLTPTDSNVTTDYTIETTKISNASGCGSRFTSSYYTDASVCIYQANTNANYDGRTKYGALYNYCAATGGTVCNSSAMSADATGSVCPAGWKLPGMTASATGSGATTDGTVKTYNNLANSYGYGNTSAGLTGMTSSPLNFVRTGDAYNGSLRNRSSSGSGYGIYWASTKYTSAYNAYSLLLYASNDRYVSQSFYNRYVGHSVRCVSTS